jgi:hypothetical protein
MSIRPPEQERATAAFRRLLDRANEDEQARVDALLVLAQRALFAPTWSAEDSGVRTLTNASGETAMPLFTGDDTLQAAALRFKWAGPGGQLSFRELPAREAIRHALARGVHFVVLDIGSPHSTEFVREELAPLLTVHSANDALSTDERTTGRLGAAVRRSTRPPQRAGDSFPPPPAAPPPAPPRAAAPATGVGLGLGVPFAELDSPFKREPTTSERPAAPARDRRLTTTDRMPMVIRTDRPFAPPGAREELSFGSPGVREERPFELPTIRREPTTGVARRPDAFPRDDVTQEVPSVPPRRPDEPLNLPNFAAPERAAPKKQSLADRIAAAVPELVDSTELPALDTPVSPGPAPSDPFAARIDAAALGFAPPEPEPRFAARPEALEAAAMITELARSSGDADAREAAAELAAMLKASAAGEKLPGDDKPQADAAAQMASLLMGGAPAAATPVAAPSPERRSALGVPAPGPATPTATSTGTHRTVSGKAAAGGLRKPEVPLSDELIDLLADKLRGYPEVEWACEASDAGELPVVGLRVDPSFLSRVAEISEVILNAGKQRGTPLAVVLLTDPEKMKRARNLQTVFFPGRRRGVKR